MTQTPTPAWLRQLQRQGRPKQSGCSGCYHRWVQMSHSFFCFEILPFFPLFWCVLKVYQEWCGWLMVPFPKTSISLKIKNPAFIRESTLQPFFDDLLHKVGDLFFTLCVWQSLPLLSRMLDPVPRALSSSSFFLYFNLFSITPQLLSPATVIEGTVETIVISPFRSPSIFFSNPSYLPLIVHFFFFFS